MSGSTNSPFSMFYQTQLAQLGVLYLDVMLTENLTLPSDVTKYPIEDGTGDVTDHITQNNEELSITGAISAASSFGMEFGPLCYSKMIDAISQMRGMHKARQTITIVTGLGRYTDMAFTNLTVNRQSGDKGGQWLSINASLRKIKKVTLKQTDLPPDTSSASGKTGTTEKKSGESGNSNQKPVEGWLHGLAAPTSGGQAAGLKPVVPGQP